ncbi:hypothetical protein NEPAR06_0309 [Nematocida parisii]|uniref:Uncharacterized protein n=1 Tax=Nematocida parisii (strain ERTm3) TaxID=935791 RepID=I3EIV1_NEMP3|nr:uncharacterized protein NEPG_01641 [Nematocida parisii ERTm1]EIJ89148.1 hypothetical protein NEQG_00967 [Nematocida parisii ERTm3]KAI5142883.1 hypothetical protein NEPAR07_0337 [Nematocida parisii]EIJ93299.1 hypothetical protein NEPG_01641 [Nematocida parisii ERTm1]KAI5153259.1 hypothetical protein NEPAR06_0309 [Nematocida parisii]KAI5156059.1 hypothetical protein NEPAR05_0269 [Nematocida parisii]|eukprot:XP_013059469.1 hypothetical protein NEPG_01641 [Nematocida parisii ERTm1]
MLITTEKHEDFETTLLEWGLSKGASSYIGEIQLYTINGKAVITYTSHVSENNYVYVYNSSSAAGESKEKEKEKNKSARAAEPTYISLQLCKQILNPIIKEAHKPKEYKVKESVIFNGQVEMKLLHIESGDIKVMTGIEGLDHAVEIFNDLPVEKKSISADTLEEMLCQLFMNTLLI